MTKELMLASVAFGLFVVCPRMAGMMHTIFEHSNISMLGTVLIGTIMSIPLLLVMVFTFEKFGTWGALAFCVLTDFGAAFIMKEISLRAGIETLIIALFVVLGVKVAPLISKIIVGFYHL